MIQTDRETFQMMLHQIMERFDRIEDRLSRMNRQTSALDGDKLLVTQGCCERHATAQRRRQIAGQPGYVRAARHYQTHSRAVPPEETRDLLHDRRAYLLQVLRGRGVPQPEGQAFASETEKPDGKLI